MRPARVAHVVGQVRGALQARPVLGPALVALAAASVAGYIAAVDPGVPGHYPTCPFLALTGYYCPGCGSLRAIHALTHGHIGEAFGYNMLSMSMLPVLGYFWVAWLVRTLRREPRTTLPHPAWVWGFGVLTLGFWILRNLPVGHFLAPTGHL